MRSVQQLGLTAPVVDQPPALDVFLGWADANPKTPASRKASMAIGQFVGRYLRQPAEVHCHALDADAIGDELMGVSVIGDGRSRNVFLVGPHGGMS